MKTKEDVLRIAASQISVKEYPPNSNRVKYNTLVSGFFAATFTVVPFIKPITSSKRL